MSDDRSRQTGRSVAALRQRVPVTDIASRRRSNELLTSISFVFGGVHHVTLPLSLPYTRGKPIMLYVVPAESNGPRDGMFTGSLECLITDDAELALDHEAGDIERHSC